MRMQLEYGRNATITVDIASGCLVAKPAIAPTVIKSVDSATAAALAAPLGYPPFSQVVMPGDRVVLAVDRAVPQVSRIVRAILDVILESKVSRVPTLPFFWLLRSRRKLTTGGWSKFVATLIRM